MLVSAFYAVAGIRWQNDWDGNLNVQCSDKQAIVGVQSYHSNRHEDRRWHFMCKKVALSSLSRCIWTRYVNNWDQPLHFRCPVNHVMTGVKSYHSNRHEDRRWSFRCCKAIASGYKTKKCHLTDNYINNWDGRMNYYSSHSVFVGAVSYHSNKRE